MFDPMGSMRVLSRWGFCKSQKISLQIQSKNVPISSGFALFVQKKQNKFIKYGSVIGYVQRVGRIVKILSKSIRSWFPYSCFDTPYYAVLKNYLCHH